MDDKALRAALEQMLERRDLSEVQAAAVLTALTSEVPPALAGGLLAALRAKGVVADELRGFARAMRSLARRPAIDAALSARAIDIVGTGGDASGSVNISTGTALLVAACGVPVIKHGNRSVSSRSGSADVLEQLGLPLPLDDLQAGECLDRCGFTFLFAPYYHPAMKAIAPVRQALGIRTIFNVLGPLTNPAAPAYQLTGAYSEPVAALMADALAHMPGLKRAFVVHAANGWDEPTTVCDFTLFDVASGQVRRSVRRPEEYGLRRCSAEELAGGDATVNAAALRAVLRGEHRGGHRDALLLGASLALECTGIAADPVAGLQVAAEAIDSGGAAEMLEELAAFGRGVRKP